MDDIHKQNIELICKYVRFMMRENNLVICEQCGELANENTLQKTLCCKKKMCYVCILSSQPNKCMNYYCEKQICQYCDLDNFCNQKCKYGM